MDFINKLIKGTGIIFASTLSVAILGYVIRIILARSLSIENYGLIYSVISLFGIFSIVIDFGLNSSISKFVAEYNTKNKYINSKNIYVLVCTFHFLISLIVSIFFILLSKQIANTYLNNPSANILIVLFSIYFALLPIISVTKTMFIAFHKPIFFAVLEITQHASVLIITYILLSMKIGVYSLFISYIIFAIIGLFISQFIFRKFVFLNYNKFRFNFNKKLISKLFNFGFFIFLFNIFNLFFGKIDIILLTIFHNLTEVGNYSVALPTVLAVSNLFSSLIIVLLPLTSEIWARKLYSKLKKHIIEIYTYCFILIPPICISLSNFSKLIITTLFSDKYIMASYSFQILILTVFFIVLTRINSTILAGIGMQQSVGKIMILSFIINLSLSFLLIPSLGSIGASISAFLSFIFASLLTYLSIQKNTKINFPSIILIKIIFANIIFYVFFMLFKKNYYTSNLLSAFYITSISLFIYITIIILSKTIDIIELIKSLMKNTIK